MSAARVPVLVVTGFLGSGKTTLLNRILVDGGRRVAVIENEYAAELGVENELVDARRGATFTEVEEVGGQCICHGGLAVFARKLRDLIRHRRDRFDVVVVETTGLADPAFAQIFFVDPFLRDAVALRAIVTVVDARHVEHHLAKAVAEGCVNEAAAQIAAADVLLLNKADLVAPERATALERRLRGLNAAAPNHPCERCDVPVGPLLDEQAFALENHPAFAEGVRHLEDTGLQKEHAAHDAEVGAVVLVGRGDVQVDALRAWLAAVGGQCGDDLWRVKGVVAVEGDAHKYVLQGVHRLLEVRRSDRPDARWAEGARPREGGRRCQIVLIGRGLAARRRALEASAAEALGVPLRAFDAGLQGPDPHAFPTGQALMLLVVACVLGFIRADGAVGEGGIAQRWLPAALVPAVAEAIAWRWHALAVLVLLVLLAVLAMARRGKKVPGAQPAR